MTSKRDRDYARIIDDLQDDGVKASDDEIERRYQEERREEERRKEEREQK